MSKLEYLNPSDWSLHVIDGENECVPEWWIQVPSKKYKFCYTNGTDFIWTYNDSSQHGELVWTRKMKEYLVERDGKYELVEAYHLDGGIEVPEGAFVLKFFKDPLADFCFYKENYTHIWQDHEKPKYWDKLTIDQSKVVSDGGVILWQRKPLLNDQYVEIEEVRQNNIDSILSERQSQYGCYEDVAKTTQDILKALRIGNYENMPEPHQESLHMIASKMARLVHGDANHLDSWVDIGGYSKLIVNLIEGGK